MDSAHTANRSRFDELVGSRAQLYYALSSEIGGVVEKQSKLFSNVLSEHSKMALGLPNAPPSGISILGDAASLLRSCIETTQGVSESGSKRSFDSHLAAISEGVPSLFCICQKTLPPQDFVKDFVDTSTFHLDRIIRAHKISEDIHYKWARAVKDMFSGLLEYSKDYNKPSSDSHEGAVNQQKEVGSSAGVAHEGEAADPPTVTSSPSTMTNLFNQLKSIGSASEVLKKHGDSTRNGSPIIAKFPGASKTAPMGKSVQNKKNRNVIDGNRWIIENFSNTTFNLNSAKINHTVCILDCSNCEVSISEKINSIAIDNCVNLLLKVGDIVSQIGLSNSHMCKLYLNGSVPTINIDKCESIETYLSEPSLSVEVYTSRSSTVNLMIPSKNEDYVEKTIPQQFKSTVKEGEIITEGVRHVGA